MMKAYISYHRWLALAWILVSVSPAIADGPPPVAALERIDLKDKYAFEMSVARTSFNVPTSYGAITGDGVNEKQLQQYLEVFLPEIDLYPSELLVGAKIKQIVLCRGLKFAGQKRGAIPSWENDTLYYDVLSQEKAEYKQVVIHHELFHMVDLQDDGQVYRDDSWRRIVPETFPYGSGGRNAQGDSTMTLLTKAVPGFVSKYATTGIEEDKAETFAHMILHPRYMERRAKEEGLLQAKMFQMKRLLKVFCPEMGERFWVDVEKVDRPDDLRYLAAEMEVELDSSVPGKPTR